MPERSPTTAVIITRDRVMYADQCLNALIRSPGVGDIHIVDHGSTWPDMLTWLGVRAGEYSSSIVGDPSRDKAFRVHVHWRANAHPRDLWTNGTLEGIVKPEQRFLVTDCDVVVPTDWRGRDWLAHLHLLLDRVPGLKKAGLQLSLDIPEHNPDRNRIIEWERNYRAAGNLGRIPGAILAGEIAWFHRASVDTTIALYPRLEAYALDPAARTSHPHHQAVHLPWLEDPETLSDELRHYYAHAEHGHWRAPDGFVDMRGL